MSGYNGQPVPDIAYFSKNRAKYPPEDLMQYAGQWIAWKADGTRVVANAPDLEALEEAVKAAGFDPENVVYSYHSPLDEDSYL